jgi:hypothetical protein
MSVRAMSLPDMVMPSMLQKVALVLARSAVLEIAQVGVERIAVQVADL